MDDATRWGVLAPGNIARKFAQGLVDAADGELVAVGSRSAERADAFADEFDVPNRHAGYEDLVGDPEVDAVYVASPHPFHAEHTILALEAGKAVLCEKPFTVNAAMAEKVIETARRVGVFCMEAMWTRFIPTMVRLRELLGQGVIGEVRMLNVDFGFRAGLDPKGRLMDPALAGGGLLDVGIYPLSLASMVLGAPERVTSLAHIGDTGVDEQAAVLLGYSQGQIAICYTAARTNTPHLGFIMGTEGQIWLGDSWWNGRTLTVHRPGADPEVVEPERIGNGYNYEAEEVGRCLRAGKIESDVMGLDESLQIVRTLDEIRGQWGLRYPFE